MKKDWTLGMLQAISDALTAHMTLQARTGLSPAYSEYLLYDPIVRVCRYRTWFVECEVKVQDLRNAQGDYPRIDFLLRKRKESKRVLLLELKYRRSNTGAVNISKDLRKLRSLLSSQAS